MEVGAGKAKDQAAEPQSSLLISASITLPLHSARSTRPRIKKTYYPGWRKRSPWLAFSDPGLISVIPLGYRSHVSQMHRFAGVISIDSNCPTPIPEEPQHYFS